jgi:hypothetical protein
VRKAARMRLSRDQIRFHSARDLFLEFTRDLAIKL